MKRLKAFWRNRRYLRVLRELQEATTNDDITRIALKYGFYDSVITVQDLRRYADRGWDIHPDLWEQVEGWYPREYEAVMSALRKE